MEFFQQAGEVLKEAGLEVAQRAKELGSIAKLNMDIRFKEEAIRKQYLEIGRKYFAFHKEDAETELKEEVAKIKEVQAEIEELKEELEQVRAAKDGFDWEDVQDVAADAEATVEDVAEEVKKDAE